MFYLFHLFRSFLPLHNPIGFGAADFIELLLAVMLAGPAIAWQRWGKRIQRLASKTVWCMILLAALPIALRLLLLGHSAIPTALGADDFSYLLLGDTLSHFRFTNPTHPYHRFFETLFVLQEPSYSSIYPLGPGMALAFGKLVFGNPWAGVAIAAGTFSALSYWMLRAWTNPSWALLGGVLSAIELGPLSHWMNTFWGGSLAAAAGCLVFGALPRLLRRWRIRDAILLGAGLAIHLLTRPFESVLLVLCVGIFFAPTILRREQIVRLTRAVGAAALVVLPAIFLILVHNRQVTGSAATLPYALCRYQYGVPCTFTVQPNPVPHRELTREQQISFEVQSFVHGDKTDTVGTFLDRLAGRVRYYRFFFLPPLYLALPFFLPSLREPRFRFVLATIIIFALGTNLYPYFYAHYIAGIACLFLLITVVALENLGRLTLRGHDVGVDAVRIVLFLCAAHFALWYGLHLAADPDAVREFGQYETWDEINQGDPVGRIAVNRELEKAPGRQLVFVRYWPKHTVTEWVYNAADIDASRVVWARDLGAEENEALRHYYPDRTAWLLEPDASPPTLTPYEKPAPEPVTITPEPVSTPSKKPSKKPELKFEEVR